MEMDKEKAIIAVFGVVLIVLAGFSGFFYSGYTNKKEQYQSLKDDYNSLKGNYNNMTRLYEDIKANYSDLRYEYNNLESDYNTLQYKYDRLQDDYDTLQSDFNDYKEMVNSRLPVGSERKNFVTPDNHVVRSRASSILDGGFDNDLSLAEIGHINDWVHHNIEYDHDVYIDDNNNIREEFWQYPSETLNLGHGDCEDKALLALSLCLAQEKVGWIYCAWVQLEKDGKWENHLCIFVDIQGDKLRIVDPTFDETDWANGGWESTEDRSETSNLHNYYDETGFDGIRVKALFNHQTYRSFSSNSEFFNWF